MGKSRRMQGSSARYHDTLRPRMLVGWRATRAQAGGSNGRDQQHLTAARRRPQWSSLRCHPHSIHLGNLYTRKLIMLTVENRLAGCQQASRIGGYLNHTS